MSDFQDSATYTQIKDYVLEHSGLKVSNLYISQIKRKCEIIRNLSFDTEIKYKFSSTKNKVIMKFVFVALTNMFQSLIIVFTNTIMRAKYMLNNSTMMWEAWGRTNALYTAWCVNSGQNPYRLFVLYAICSHEPITQKGISDYTGLSKQTVSTIMRSLKEDGYVILCASETDRREKNIQLTHQGIDYAKEVLSPLFTLEEQVFDIMGEERMKQMSDAITFFNIIFEKEMEKQKYELKKN